MKASRVLVILGLISAVLCIGQLAGCDSYTISRAGSVWIGGIKDKIILEKGEICQNANIEENTKFKLESLAKEVRNWSTDAELPWRDVALSILKYPENVNLNCTKCSFCDHHTVIMRFSSPAPTWAMSCGSSGPLVFCPQCKRQLSYKCSTVS